MSQSDKTAEDDAISLGSEDSSDDDADDDDYVPPEQRGIKKKRSKKPRKPKQPDLVALSLPKPTRRLDPDLDLGDAALSGCSFDDLDIAGWCAIPGWQRREGFLPSSAPASAKLQLLPGRRPTRGAPEDVRVAEYRAIYSVQLPGMPFYHSDVCHALLTLDPAGEDVSGGATFRIGLLRTKEPRGGPVLVFDVLALAGIVAAVILFIVFMERAQRRIPIQYAKRLVGNRVAAAQSTHLPLRLNMAGVIPAIFASSILMFPATVATWTDAPWMQAVQGALHPGDWRYNVFFVSLITSISRRLLCFSHSGYEGSSIEELTEALPIVIFLTLSTLNFFRRSAF
jgi:hypothetical protein